MAGPASVAFNMKPGEISGSAERGRRPGGAANCGAARAFHLRSWRLPMQRDQLRERLANEKRQEVLGVFLNDLSTRLEKEGKVKINKTEMDNLTKSRS